MLPLFRRRLRYESVESRFCLCSIGGVTESDDLLASAHVSTVCDPSASASGSDLRTFDEAASATNQVTPQATSIRDRVIDSSGNDSAFKRATSVPATSPVLSQARDLDLVVRNEGTLGDPITAVVLKPSVVGWTYSIPSPSDGVDAFEFLHQHLAEAVRRDARTILFPLSHVFELTPPAAGTQHDVGPYEQQAHLTLRGLHDVTVDLNGSTLLFTEPTLGIRIVDSQRLVLQNGRLQGSTLLSSIAAVVEDDGPAGIRFDVLPAYRPRLDQLPAEDVSLVTVGSASVAVDGQWQLDSDGYSELFTNRGRPHNNFVYRDGSFVATSGLLRDTNPFQPDRDHVWLLHQNNAGHGILLDHWTNLEDITLQALQFINIPGMAIAGELNRGLHVNQIEIGDDNSQLGFLGVSSDAVHINANGGDIVIENSRFGPNGDDKITIKGNYWKVDGIDRNTNTLQVTKIDRGASLSRWGSVGDRVIFVDGQYGVVAESRLSKDSQRESGIIHEVQLESIPSQVRVGSYLGNVDASGGRVVIRNNVFRETRAHGVLVQTSHVVVQDNAFSGIAAPPIKLNLAQELWYESINVQNVLIEDNVFQRSAFSSTKSTELIHLYQRDELGNAIEIIGDVRIVGNRILDQLGADPPGTDPPEPPSVPPSEPSIEVLYRNRAPAVTAKEVEARVELVNTDSVAVDLTHAELRYHFHPDGETPVVSVRVLDDTSVSLDGSFVDDGFLAFHFSNAEPLLPGQRLAFRFSVTNQHGAAFDQSNDGSFIASQTSLASTDAIDLVFSSLLDPGSSDPPDVDPPAVDPPDEPEPVNPPNSGDPPALASSRLDYRNRVADRFTDEVEAQIDLIHSGGQSRDYQDAEIRYYFDPDGLNPDVRVRPLNVSDGAIEGVYVASGGYVAFRIRASLILHPGEKARFRFTITNEQGLPFDQANDSSFQAEQTSLSPSNRIDVHFPGSDTTVPPPPPDSEPKPPANTEPDPPTDSSEPPIQVWYRNREPSKLTDEIDAQIELVNVGSAAIDLRGGEVRYDLDSDGNSPVMDVRPIAKTTGSMSAPTLQSEWISDGGYIAFRIATSFVLEPGERLRFRFSATDRDGNHFDQSNDGSYRASQTKLGVTNSIDFVLEADSTSSRFSPPSASRGLENPAMDVNADGRVSALDALTVINMINRDARQGEATEGPRLGQDQSDIPTVALRGDVNGDQTVTALDALMVINSLSDSSMADQDTSRRHVDDPATRSVDLDDDEFQSSPSLRF
ncbi:MAG: dockerin type I domain-containing protein [Planctomycetota bacterium]